MRKYIREWTSWIAKLINWLISSKKDYDRTRESFNIIVPKIISIWHKNNVFISFDQVSFPVCENLSG